MTAAEKAFVNRMVPHVEAGMSFDEAAKQVLADDERLYLIATAKDDAGEKVRDVLTTTIWTSCHLKACAQRISL